PAALTVALFATVLPAAEGEAPAVTVSVQVDAAPRVLRSFPTRRSADLVQVDDADTKSSPAGSVSMRLAASAESGPLLCRVSVKGTGAPGSAQPAEADFVWGTSAGPGWGGTWVPLLGRLLRGFGSRAASA